MAGPGAAGDHGVEPTPSLAMLRMTPMAGLSMAAALCLVAPAAAAHASSRPYVDLVDFPYKEANWDRFYALQGHLMREFHDLCGATYCQGTHANHVLLQFRCSVHAATGTVTECALVIAAGNLEVDAATGKVMPDNRTWACAVPLAPHTPVEALHAALGRRDALILPLPGTGRSVHDALLGCLGEGGSLAASHRRHP
jgi:hypothetical protein